MLLTLPKLKELIAKLEASRQQSGNAGDGAYCTAPNVGADGEVFRWEPKPRAREPLGRVYPDGSVLIEQNGAKGVRVSLGQHGRAHLAIDPSTGKVACAKCAEAKR